MSSLHRRILRRELGGMKGALARGGLRALSLPYGAAVATHKALYAGGLKKATRLAAPVVSVGNITAGGTGKTPMTQWVVERLRAAGAKPGVLTRGYKAGPDGLADEAALLAANLPGLPVAVGADRARGGRRLIAEAGVDCLVLDDGFQHHALARDLDIVLLSSEDPWGGGRLLPAGFLRESLSALQRAHWVGIVGRLSDAGATLLRARLVELAPDAGVFFAERRPVAWTGLDGRAIGGPSWILGKEVAAFCGLAAPEGFVRQVEALGGRVLRSRFYDDHHRYTAGDVDAIRRWAGDALPVTTQKDAVKLARLWGAADLPAILKIDLRIRDGAGRLEQALVETWRAGRGDRAPAPEGRA